MKTPAKGLFRLRLYAVYLCTGLSLYSQTAFGETLKEIYQAALQSDPQLREAEAQFNAASDIVNVEKSARRPQVDAKATYGSSNTSNSNSDRNSSTDAAGVALTLRQSLWNQELGNNIERGQMDEQVAKQQLENTRLSLITRSAEAYFNLLRAIDQRRTAINEQQTLNKQLEQTKERFDVGLVSINDVTESQAAFDNTVASAIAADANVGIRSENLAILIGRYPTTIAPLAEGFSVSTLDIRDRDYWVDNALDSNLSLRIAQLQLNAAEFRHKSTRANQKPKLNGNLGYNFNRDLQDNSNSQTTSLGIELNLPLYGGGRFSAQRRQSAQNLIEAQERLKRTRRSVTQQSRSLFLSVKSDRALISARQQSILSSKSALDVALASYDAGTKDIVDLVNAQQKVFQAQRNYSDALYNYIINYLKLKEVSGQLNEEDIDTLDGLLASETQVSVDNP